MTFLKRTLPIFLMLIALLLVGCSTLAGTESPSPGTNGGNTPASNTAPTTSAPTPQPTSAPTQPVVLVNTATVTVNGKQETILIDSQGKALYYLTADTPFASHCTGSCAQAWPPLLSTGIPLSSTALPAKLGVRVDANGKQIEYGGHLLYTFSGDTAPGQVSGEGIQSFGGTWHVATTGPLSQGGD